MVLHPGALFPTFWGVLLEQADSSGLKTNLRKDNKKNLTNFQKKIEKHKF